MAYWWANQGRNLTVALGQCSLWTCPRADGHHAPDRECIKDMHLGDVVFHYGQGEIRAVSQVVEEWRPALRPAKGYETESEDPDDGWLVRIEPIDDDVSISLATAADIIEHGRRYGPINASGGAKRMYLFPLEPDEGQHLLWLSGSDTKVGNFTQTAHSSGDYGPGSRSVWMEIRRDQNSVGLGTSLHASRQKQYGARMPAFDRVRSVRPGDRVLHWWRKAIVGTSVVAKDAVESPNAVDVELRDFVRLAGPIALDDIRSNVEQIVEVFHATRNDRRWCQFPFQIDHPNSENPFIHGAPTTYFAPVPTELLAAIPGLAEQINVTEWAASDDLRRQVGNGTKLAFESDPARRKAVELHAEKVAIAAFEAEGYRLVGRPGKPYDLAFERGTERLHVEVKGSSVAVDSILLTRNEVTHASEHVTTLVVVDQIEVRLDADGDYECSAGHLRRWDSWVPEQEALTALQHAYVLPSSAG